MMQITNLEVVRIMILSIGKNFASGLCLSLISLQNIKPKQALCPKSRNEIVRKKSIPFRYQRCTLSQCSADAWSIKSTIYIVDLTSHEFRDIVGTCFYLFWISNVTEEHAVVTCGWAGGKSGEKKIVYVFLLRKIFTFHSYSYQLVQSW